MPNSPLSPFQRGNQESLPSNWHHMQRFEGTHCRWVKDNHSETSLLLFVPLDSTHGSSKSGHGPLSWLVSFWFPFTTPEKRGCREPTHFQWAAGGPGSDCCNTQFTPNLGSTRHPPCLRRERGAVPQFHFASVLHKRGNGSIRVCAPVLVVSKRTKRKTTMLTHRLVSSIQAAPHVSPQPPALSARARLKKRAARLRPNFPGLFLARRVV